MGVSITKTFPFYLKTITRRKGSQINDYIPSKVLRMETKLGGTIYTKWGFLRFLKKRVRNEIIWTLD